MKIAFSVRPCARVREPRRHDGVGLQRGPGAGGRGGDPERQQRAVAVAHDVGGGGLGFQHRQQGGRGGGSVAVGRQRGERLGVPRTQHVGVGVEVGVGHPAGADLTARGDVAEVQGQVRLPCDRPGVQVVDDAARELAVPAGPADLQVGTQRTARELVQRDPVTQRRGDGTRGQPRVQRAGIGGVQHLGQQARAHDPRHRADRQCVATQRILLGLGQAIDEPAQQLRVTERRDARAAGHADGLRRQRQRQR